MKTCCGPRIKMVQSPVFGVEKDDTILDVVDIMSQTYVNIDEVEIDEDIILDVVDIISL